MFLLNSSVGDINIVSWETVESESATWTMDHSDMNKIGYIIKPVGDLVEVTLWIDFDNEKLEKSYNKVGELVLKGLKRYIEFIEEGGDPNDYDKNEVLVSP